MTSQLLPLAGGGIASRSAALSSQSKSAAASQWNGPKHALVLPCVLVTLALLQACSQRSDSDNSAGAKATAAPDLKIQAESGDRDAMFSLAQEHDGGLNGQKKDASMAFRWYLRAAEAGLPRAMGEVARRYRDGDGVREDFEASKVWADKGATLGDAESIYLSATRGPWDLFLGFELIANSEAEESRHLRDTAEEIDRLRRAAAAGSVEAKFRLAQQLRTGIWYSFKGKRKAALQPEQQEALKYFREAADVGHPLALLALAEWHQKGGDGLKADLSVAAGYWDRVEGLEGAEAQYRIGHELVPPEKKYYVKRLWRDEVLTFEQTAHRAREWLEKAAKQGHSRAALQLGEMLSMDRYGYTDEVRAFELLLQAADAGLVTGQTRVAWAYYKGLGVAKDYVRAYTWALRASTHPTATRGQMSGAQRFLAQLLVQGVGVEKDPVLAYAWANVSAAAGEETAKVLVSSLDRTLDAMQVREAQQISSAWKIGEDMKRPVSAVPSGRASGSTMAEGSTSLKLAASGTGFFVNAAGVLVTNHHVAGACAEIRLPVSGARATSIASDSANDLVALRADKVPAFVRLADSAKVKQGQEVVAFGFPLEGYLPSTGNITTGLVSALSGPANNSSLIQISAPVQQGNSGGPVLDLKGEVVGVVVGKADAIRIAKATGDILQNVNFAVSVGTLRAFLDANSIEYSSAAYFASTKKPETLAEEARKYTAKVECWR